MTQYKTIKNLQLLRSINTLLPLKHKLKFLIRKYLISDTNLAIRYYKSEYICTTLNDINRSTIVDIILMGAHGQPEHALINTIKNKLPGNAVFIDVGGNIGTFLWQFVEKCDQVFVFEPVPRLNAVIKNSIQYNNDKKIVVISKAVGEEPGTIQMLDNNNSNIVNSNSAKNVIDVQVTTLDNELQSLPKIDFIKIDVEGYEMHVLNGAKKILDKHHPLLLVEVHPGFLKNYGKQHSGIIRFLEDKNYHIRYFSFLGEQRISRVRRIFSRWSGNKGIEFSTKEAFFEDVAKEPYLSSYHFYCEPK